MRSTTLLGGISWANHTQWNKASLFNELDCGVLDPFLQGSTISRPCSRVYYCVDTRSGCDVSRFAVSNLMRRIDRFDE